MSRSGHSQQFLKDFGTFGYNHSIYQGALNSIYSRAKAGAVVKG